MHARQNRSGMRGVCAFALACVGASCTHRRVLSGAVEYMHRVHAQVRAERLVLCIRTPRIVKQCLQAFGPTGCLGRGASRQAAI